MQAGRRSTSGWMSVQEVAAAVPEPETPVTPEPVPAEPEMVFAESPSNTLGRVDRVLREEIERRGTPGATFSAGQREVVVRLAGYGRTRWDEDAPSASPKETLYDLASLTKIVATTTAVMLLVEDGKIDLDRPVQQYLPGFRGAGKERVTVRHLLAHTSGLPAWVQLTAGTREDRFAQLLATPLASPAGTRMTYTDVGMNVLWALAEQVADEPLASFVERRVFRPLGMRRTGFSPGKGCIDCAPTSRTRAGDLFRGEPSDPIAQKLGGVAGNAGLFSTAEDLSRFAAMVASGGALNGVRVLREETVRQMLQPQPGAQGRGLGWDASCPEEEPLARGASCRRTVGYGHTGWSGTAMWVDPKTGRWAVLLTNRVYEPRAQNRIQQVRRETWAAVAAAPSLPSER